MDSKKCCYSHELFTDQYLRELFKEFDPKKTGYIELVVFEKLLNSIGFVQSTAKIKNSLNSLFPSKSTLTRMMRDVDVDGNGMIDDVEFIQFVRLLLNGFVKIEILLQKFQTVANTPKRSWAMR